MIEHHVKRHAPGATNARGVAGMILAAAIVLRVAAQANAAGDTMLVARMGVVMPLAQARHDVGFAPFDPPRTIVAAALLPPFHGEDSRTTRGIGVEYVDAAKRRYVLAQWPRNGGSVDGFLPFTGDAATCADVRMFSRGTKPYGIVWTTPHGLVLTLQADGANDARTLEIEWEKLIRRGACR